MGSFAPSLNVLSLAAARDKSKLSSGDAWILLLDFNWQGQHVRLCRNNEPMSFDAGDGLGVQSYQEFNFELVVERTGGGTLPTIQLQASNVLGLLEGLIEQYSGAVGGTVNIYVVNTANPSGEPDLALTTQIMRTETSDSIVTFTLGAPMPQRQLFPRYLYRATFCIWVPFYSSAAFRSDPRSKWCGYQGPLATCDGTYDGGNGCLAHNNTKRFGAFPGIGTNGGAIASQT